MTKAFFLLMILSANFVCAGHPIVIGIAGGTGSGKSTLAKKIQSSGLNSVLIEQDCYYKDLAHLSMAERNATNFDHPLSIDFERLYEDLLSLKSGSSIEKPIYSFKSHAREKGATHVSSADIIVVEGILIFTDERIRNLCDLKIYVHTDDDVRILRRTERDIQERGRDLSSVKQQYLATVKPMHSQFVEPSKQFADVIIPGDSDTSNVVNLILSGLRDNIIRSR